MQDPDTASHQEPAKQQEKYAARYPIPKQPKGNKRRNKRDHQNYDTREKQKKLADSKRGNQELSNKYKVIVANYVSIKCKAHTC
jgi:hypothetical protein